MARYKALLVSPDGDWVTDYEYDTIPEVEEALANRGSTWFFYPIEAIIRNNGNFTSKRQRIVEAPGSFAIFEGKSIATFTQAIAEMSGEEMLAMLEG